MSIQYSGDKITFADGSIVASGWSGFKNRIINGAMVIDQRNAGASVTPTTTNTYALDRWQAQLGAASKFSIQQSSVAPVGFTNSLLVTSLAATSLGSTDYYAIRQIVEGFNASDFGWGTANASTVTLSFWVRSSLTGTFGGYLNNATDNYAYPFTYTVSSANTWEQKSITITGATSGTWNTTNGQGIKIGFGLGVGSTYSGTAGSWSANNYLSATGATSVVGTSGATFYITGVQLEKGSTATSFDYRPYGTELALCQRYYQVIPQSLTFGQSNTAIMLQYNFPVLMRATPTGSIPSALYWENLVFGSVGSLTSASLDLGHVDNSGGDIRIAGTFSPSPSYGSMSKLGRIITLSAEL
jgi:hypothetical protein